MVSTAPALILCSPHAAASGVLSLDADQEAVVSLPAGSGPVLLWGAPGTGKSTVLIEAAARRVERDGLDPAKLLLLAPSRQSAARLRDALTQRLARSLSVSPVRTWSSYAFDLIRRARVEGRMPELTGTPKLLSGPEQDLIIRELLLGHRNGLVPGPAWPVEMREALPTRGFRQEVRQLFDRVIEAGLNPAELVDLGHQTGRPDWVAAADLYAEYREVVDWSRSGSFDPAGIITGARSLLERDPEFLAQERERLQLILVDDIQEANEAVHALLALLARGQDVITTAAPDVVVQGFRGARPDLASELRETLSTDQHQVHELALTVSHRLLAPLAAAWTSVAERISQSQGGHRARNLVQPSPERGSDGNAGPTEPPQVRAVVVSSEVHAQRLVAERVLHFQLERGFSLGDIGVIVRTGAQLDGLQRYLSSHGIPVKVPVAENPVRDEAAVRPLLDALAVCLDPDLLTPEMAVTLLTSRIGGANSINLRRLRQALRQAERASGGGRASDALLAQTLAEPTVLEALGWDGRNALRLSRMLRAGHDALQGPAANAESVLWALWDASGCSDYWSELALKSGPAGVRADHDLDAIMALFQSAERYVDQLPGSGPREFLEYLRSQDLPMDSLAARAVRHDAVELMTPASAAGREWPVVIVAGLQDGVWPNTRLRGELLGSQLLADVLSRGASAALALGPGSRLREVRYDELRSFSAAISRASRELLCIAAANEDLQPSEFLDIVAPLAPGERERPITEVPRPKTLRSLVAELRQELETTGNPEAAAVLAGLAQRRVPGADPAQWWGLAPLSSTAPIVPAGEPVHVSPSRVEAVQKSPLNWFISQAGGEVATDFARSLGTLVHAIAQDMPDAAGSEYVAELERRWASLGMKDNWEGQADYARATEMVRKLAVYVIEMRNDGRTLRAVEHDFSVDIPSASGVVARLRGQVDRLELDHDGKVVIVDLKTGRSKPTAKELPEHPQLAAYQAAIHAGAFDELIPGASQQGSGGALLAQLGGTTKKVDQQRQDALKPDEDWAVEMIRNAAE
ncbi:MAG: ATP-dependent helicase [Acidobacteria bacterium]|nr:ATP-dependent helicase [Acidobacteriota bacterium]